MILRPGRYDVWQVRRSWQVKSSVSVIDALSPIQKHALEISSKSSADTALLCGCVDTDEDEVSLFNALIDIGRKEEVATARLTDNVFKTWLIDGQIEFRAVPGIDTSLVQVDDGDSNMRTFQRDNRASWATF